MSQSTNFGPTDRGVGPVRLLHQEPHGSRVEDHVVVAEQEERTRPRPRRARHWRHRRSPVALTRRTKALPAAPPRPAPWGPRPNRCRRRGPRAPGSPGPRGRPGCPRGTSRRCGYAAGRPPGEQHVLVQQVASSTGRGRCRHPRRRLVPRGDPVRPGGPGLSRPDRPRRRRWFHGRPDEPASRRSSRAPSSADSRTTRDSAARPTTRSPRSRARRSSWSATTTWCSIPTALRLLVEEAYRSNAAIVGPKLVDFDNPEVLLDVGRAIDRLGGSHTGIETGELDQEQHDGVRDVFYVSSAVMLVRTDLFTELGGFDPETFPGPRTSISAGAPASREPGSWSCPTRVPRTSRPPSNVELPNVRRARHGAQARARGAHVVLAPDPALGRSVRARPVVGRGDRVLAHPAPDRAAFAELGAWWWNLLHVGRLRRGARTSSGAPPGPRPRAHRAPGRPERADSGTFLGHHHADERMGSDRRRAPRLVGLGRRRAPPPGRASRSSPSSSCASSDPESSSSHGVPAVGQLAAVDRCALDARRVRVGVAIHRARFGDGCAAAAASS